MAVDIKLTPARVRLLREVVTGRTAYHEAPPRARSFAYTPRRNVTAQADELVRAGLIHIETNHNGWRLAYVPTLAGARALAAHDNPNGA